MLKLRRALLQAVEILAPVEIGVDEHPLGVRHRLVEVRQVVGIGAPQRAQLPGKQREDQPPRRRARGAADAAPAIARHARSAT